jgi:3-dehydroquinate synthase
MVDASIGGKTGIDFKGIKNMIGVIALPKLVFVHPIFLQTLTPRHILSGYAEMLKHGMISDRSYFSELLQNKVSDMKDWALLIQKSIEIKNSIVEQDPLEKGIRKSLNFGHTIGHALESYFLEDEENAFLHGEAIAWGMVLESMLSMDLLGMKESDYKQLLQFVENNYRPIKLLASEYEKLIAFMNHDKKNIDGKIAFVLLKDIAEVQLDVFCTKQQIQKVFSIINTSHH